MAETSTKEKGYAAVAVLLLLCAVALTVYSFRVTPARTARLKRKLNDLRVVQALYQQMQGARQAVVVFEQDVKEPARALRDIVRENLPEVSADVRQRQSVPAADGWMLQQAEIVFNDVMLEKVGRFIQTAESKRPPWVLQECTIVASEGDSGSGRATLMLQALERGKESDR